MQAFSAVAADVEAVSGGYCRRLTKNTREINLLIAATKGVENAVARRGCRQCLEQK